MPAYLVGFSLSRFLGTGTDGGEVRDYFLRVLSLSRSRLSSVDHIMIVKHMCNSGTTQQNNIVEANEFSRVWHIESWG